jgi:hypothetical protein
MLSRKEEQMDEDEDIDITKLHDANGGYWEWVWARIANDAS